MKCGIDGCQEENPKDKTLGDWLEHHVKPKHPKWYKKNVMPP
jgi:hypothetical protein